MIIAILTYPLYLKNALKFVKYYIKMNEILCLNMNYRYIGI